MPTQIPRIRLGTSPGGRPSFLAGLVALVVGTMAFVLGLGLLVFMFVAGMVGLAVMWVRRRFGLGSPRAARAAQGPGAAQSAPPPPAGTATPEAEPVAAEELENFRGNLDEWFEGRRDGR
jgi:predicted lipid-binding transport protein (Tim44 family)